MRHKYFSHFRNLQRGETLIEALGALAIIAIVVSASAIAVTTALSNASFNQKQTQATKYAQEGIEIMRSIRNTNYTQFSTYNGTYCLPADQTTINTSQTICTTPNVGDFIRTVTIEASGCRANVSQVTVRVRFTDSKCQSGVYCHDQSHDTCLSTINPVQAP